MPVSVSSLSVSDLLDALSGANEATYLWSPGDDTIDWAVPPSKLKDVSEFSDPTSGAAWRAMLISGDVGARDAWLSEPQTETGFTGTYVVGSADGSFWVEERLVRIEDAADGAARYLGRIRNVSSNQEHLANLNYLARFDELTGHLSRSHLRTLLARRLEKAKADNNTISFGLLGLDNLSGFNSMFGFDVADGVLVRIGEEILRHLGPKDAIGRIGSSKFAIVFADCAKADLPRRLGEIQSAIRDTPIETGAGPVAVTVSAAGLSLPEDGATTDDAFAAAEDTLNHAKDFGLDQVLIYSPDDNLSARRRENIAMADDLVAAVKENRLRLAYQPIVQAHDTKQVAFYECLLRLTDRSGALLNAGMFMPVAEKLGLVRILDRRVVELAFETLRRNTRVRLSINVSPQSLRDSRWRALFEELAAENPNALERLILEVTEATAIDDADDAGRVLNHFRDMGCAIALDDFGAGYTSFQQMRDLTLDIVKIDGGYIRNVFENPSDQVFVKALTSIAKQQELLIVAEMVDSDEAGALLRTIGVDTFQGFHFGRPEVAPDWLNQDEADQIVQAVAAR